MRRSAYIPDSPAAPPMTSHLRSPPCGKVTSRLLPGLARLRRSWGTGWLSRPSFFTAIETTQCIRATAIMSSRRRGSRTCKRTCIAVGYPEDMPIPAQSIPTRTDGQSLSTGRSMVPDTPGREAAPLAPTPIRADRTPQGRCCASSSITRAPRPVRVDSAVGCFVYLISRPCFLDSTPDGAEDRDPAQGSHPRDRLQSRRDYRGRSAALTIRPGSRTLTIAIAPTVPLGCFDTLPVAGTRRGDGERDDLGIRQRTCTSGGWPALELHVSRAKMDDTEPRCARIALDAPTAVLSAR